MNIKNFYEILYEEFGDLNWWPVDINYHKNNKTDPRFEIIIGTILTQNTAWLNAEKALKKLKKNKILDLKSLNNIKINKLKNYIKSSGYYNQKADRILNLIKYFNRHYKNNIDDFLKNDVYEIRKELLDLNGIGPETADSILLYAGNKPIFVVDAYTKRICKRIPLNKYETYDEIQKYFHHEFSKYYKSYELTKIYNQMHAMIVIFAKNYCKKKPLCKNCPIKNQCKFKK